MLLVIVSMSLSLSLLLEDKEEEEEREQRTKMEQYRLEEVLNGANRIGEEQDQGYRC